MKRLLIITVAVVSFLFAATGCKKQTVTEDTPIATDSIPHYNDVHADPSYSSKGFLVGKIMPETKFTLLLYNDDRSYSDYTIVNRTGAFMMKDIEAGNYTLFVQPGDPNLNPVELTKITVDSMRTTNLGLIFLP